MKKTLLSIVTVAMSMAAMAQAPAFPGAEGVARLTTTGGRGGKVIHVTNLNDSGTGSLRAACTASGARIVVFDVSGIIELKSQLKINKDDITIEGQTAPGDGICLKNYTFNISANNVIVRFIRSRMGDAVTSKGDDAMNAYFHTGSEKKNVIIDHCTMSWSTDECGSFYGINNFTLQWCVLSESLANSIHEKGAHGYGGIWGGNNAAYHHNLLASHTSRNPRFDHDYVSNLKGPVDYINNVVYNWGGNSSYGGESCNTTGTYKKYNMINNYYKAGSTSSHKNRIVNPTTKCSNCTGESTGKVNLVPGHFYITGNYVEGYPAVTADNWQGVHPDDNTTAVKNSIKSDTRFLPDGYTQNLISTHSATKAFEKVLDYAGASYRRDVIDQRVTKEAKSGTFTYVGSNGSTGGFIDSPGDVGGWPTYLSDTRLTDTDNDGMPDAWEQAVGGKNLDPTGYDLDSKKYYTNIEVYCNALVEDLMKAEVADAEQTVDEYYPVVSKIDGIPYYDGTTAAGGYENENNEDDTTALATGAITWTFDLGTDGQTASLATDISDYIAVTEVTKGAHLDYAGTKKVNNVTMTQFNCNQAKRESAPSADNAVSFLITPKSGYLFTPKNVKFYISRIGTDAGKYTVNWDSKVLQGEQSPARNNEAGGYFTYYNEEVTGIAPTADRTGLVLNLYDIICANELDGNGNPMNPKQIALANIVISGKITSTTAIRTIEDSHHVVSTKYFALSGTEISQPKDAHGIVIKVEKLSDGKTITTKIIK